MTPAYINVVLEAYKLKKKKKDVWRELQNPTRANIKRACLKNCAKNYHRKDGRILEDFFEEGNNKEVLLQKMRRTDSEDFRTVQNFLQGETSNPRERPVELAAWLIDFNPRPYDETVDYDLLLKQTKQAIVDWEEGQKEKRASPPIEDDPNEPDDVEVDPEPELEPKPPEPPKFPIPMAPSRTWTWVATLTMLAIVTGFLSYNNWGPKSKKDEVYNTVSSSIRPVDCMIWLVDHYEKIPCDYRYDDGDAVVLDSVVLRRFKKITNPETISIEDLEKVWYNKQNNEVEYFTDSGVHPLNKKSLKPLSAYIYTTRIVPLRDSLSRRGFTPKPAN